MDISGPVNVSYCIHMPVRRIAGVIDLFSLMRPKQLVTTVQYAVEDDSNVFYPSADYSLSSMQVIREAQAVKLN